MWASARDWARYGQLYLDDGMVGGERILPEGWVDYSARLTPGSETYGYGAGFWTNRGTTGGAAKRVGLGMTPHSFMARGTQEQYIVIVPSARLVVVRRGRGDTKAKGVKFGRKPNPTPHQQKEARKRLEAGETQRTVARSYNVSQRTISRLT